MPATTYYGKMKLNLKNCEERVVEQGKLIEAKNQEIVVLKEQNLRFQADVENFRKKLNEESELIIKYASARVITELLPFLDSLENSNDESIKVLQRQFYTILEREGLREIADINSKFDPTKHETIGMEDGGEENTIKRIIRKGYYLNGRVLRPEMVILNKG